MKINTDGSLTKVNQVETTGQGSYHISLSPDGKLIAVTNYDSSNIVLYPVKADGSVGALSDTQQQGCENKIYNCIGETMNQ